MGMIPFGSAMRESDGALYRFNSLFSIISTNLPILQHSKKAILTLQVQVLEWLADARGRHNLL